MAFTGYLSAPQAGEAVPSEALRANMKRQAVPVPFMTWLKELCYWALHENRAEETLRHRKWYRNDRFYQGQHLIWFDSRTGLYLEAPRKAGSPYYPNNQFRAHVNSIHKEVVRSNAELMVKAKSEDPKTAGAARAAKAFLIDAQRRHWTAEKKQLESMNALLKGNYFRYDYWDPSGGERIEKPVYGSQEMPQPNEVACMDCGSVQPETGSEMDFACAQCGSENVQGIQGAPLLQEQQTGSESTMSGDLSLHPVPPDQVKLHLHARTLQESPYLIWSRLILKDIADLLYPYAEYTCGAGYDDVATLYEANLERSVGFIGTSGTHYYQGGPAADAMMRFTRLRQFWFQPIMYAAPDNVLDRDLEIGFSGVQLPAGVPMLDLFPDGMYVAMLGDNVVDMRNESFLDHWSHGRWFVVPSRIWGDSFCDDLIEPTRQLNELDSLQMENIMYNAAPGGVYNPLKVERGKMVSSPSHWMPIKNPMVTDDLRKFLWQREGRPLPSEVPMFAERKRQDMQFMASSFSLESGVSGPGGGTATGLQIVREAVTSNIAVPLELMAGVGVQMAYQLLKLEQKNDTSRRYLTLISPYGEPEGQWFQSSDIEGDLEITARPHSWIPRSQMEMKQDVQEAGIAAGIPGGIWSDMFPPDAKPVFSEVLGVPLNNDSALADRRKQRLEIDRIALACQIAVESGLDPIAFAVGMPMPVLDPMSGMPSMEVMGAVPGMEPQVTVDPEDDHIIHSKVCKEWLKTDSGMNAPPEIKEAIRMHMQMHDQEAEKQMMQAMMKQAAMGGMGAPGGGSPAGKPAKPPGQKDDGKSAEGGGQPRPKKEDGGKPPGI